MTIGDTMYAFQNGNDTEKRMTSDPGHGPSMTGWQT